jgi:transposase
MRPPDRRAYLAYDVGRLKRQGHSIRSAAAALGINRRTVKRLLKDEARRRDEGESALSRALPPETCPRGSQLDAYDAQIRAWLEEYPKLSAERCLEKLLERGFTGKRTIVQDRVRAIRREIVPAELAAVVSYAPGQRAEFDWSSFVVEKPRQLKVQIWDAQLSHSRYPTPQARTDQRQRTIFVCLRTSLELWGGVPLEILTDTMPGVVDRWECGLPILNARFVDFAAHYGFTALVAARGCPTYKARCERRFRSIKENALAGRRFDSVAAVDEYFPTWVRDKVLTRRHPERPESVAEVFAEEQLLLQPLPTHPYDTRDVAATVFTSQGYALFQTNLYPAPGAHPGELAYVVADATKVVVCNAKAQRLAEHARLPDGAKIQLPPPTGMRRPRLDMDQLTSQLDEWHVDATAFARGVRERSRQAASQLARLLMLQAQWKREDILAAMRRAMDYGGYETAIVERVLHADYEPRSLPEAIAQRSVERVRKVMKDHRVPARSIDSYPCLQRGDHPSTPATAMGADDVDGGTICPEDSDE